MFIVAIDFDGTIVDHRYPDIGEPNPCAIFYMDKFIKAGAKLILFTMRSHAGLDDAKEYLAEAGIEFFGFNCNPDQFRWTSSPKPYANVYIDDAAYGCPMVYPDKGRPYVDWRIVGPGVLKLIEEKKKNL